MAKYQQGIYKPLHPQKYKGDVRRIIYRSSWELKMLRKLDLHPDVIQYSSEEIVVNYRSPIDNKPHRYFVDFYVKYKDVTGKVRQLLIEIKPLYQTVPPKKTPNKRQKTLITETATYLVNQAKWEAAKIFAANRGWEFQVWTEKDLDIRW